MLLLAYAAAPQQLVSLHFTAEPPSLQAQLLPLSLPEIASSGKEELGWEAGVGFCIDREGVGACLLQSSMPAVYIIVTLHIACPALPWCLSTCGEHLSGRFRMAGWLVPRGCPLPSLSPPLPYHPEPKSTF